MKNFQAPRTRDEMHLNPAMDPCYQVSSRPWRAVHPVFKLAAGILAVALGSALIFAAVNS